MNGRRYFGIDHHIGRTPLVRLRRVSELTGCEILAKAEFMNPGSSVKDRTALSIITEAETAGKLKPGDTIVEGTRRTLDLATQRGARRFLFTSSGAVYGRQAPDLSHISEDYQGGPDQSKAASPYAEGKRSAETLCAM